MSRRNPSTLRRSLRLLTDPDLVGWPFFLWSLGIWLLSFYPQVLRLESALTWQNTLGWIVSALIGQIALFAFLVLARALWWRRPWMPRHPAVAVWSFIVGSIIGVLAANAAMSALPTSAQGLVFGADQVVIGVIGLCFTGSVLVALRDYRSSVMELRSKQLRMVEALSVGRSTLAEERARTERAVDAALQEALASLEGDTSEAVDRMTVASEEILRPLSHELATSSAGIAPVDIETPRPRWNAIITEVASKPLIAPRATAAITLLFALPITFRAVDSQSGTGPTGAASDGVVVSVDVTSLAIALLQLASVFLGTLAAAWLMVIVTRRLLTWVAPRARWLVTIAGGITVGVLSWGIIGLLITGVGRQTLTAPEGGAPVAVILVIALVSLLMGAARAVGIAGRDVRQQIDEANRTLQWHVTRINQLIWDQRRTMALIVHGPLRAALIAGALQLANATGDSVTSLQALIRERIESARRMSLSDHGGSDLRSELRGLEDLWRGTCEITLDVDPDTYTRVEADPVAAGLAMTLIGEACSNAMVHGDAHAVTVSVRASDDQLDIEVHNDGRAPESTHRSGLGSTVLDEVTLSWSLSTLEGITSLKCAIPLV